MVRNRTKRRLRECFRHRIEMLTSGLYVVVARPSAAQRSYGELSQSVDYLLRKMKLMNEQPDEEGKRL